MVGASAAARSKTALQFKNARRRHSLNCVAKVAKDCCKTCRRRGRTARSDWSEPAGTCSCCRTASTLASASIDVLASFCNEIADEGVRLSRSVLSDANAGRGCNLKQHFHGIILVAQRHRLHAGGGRRGHSDPGAAKIGGTAQAGVVTGHAREQRRCATGGRRWALQGLGRSACAWD